MKEFKKWCSLRTSLSNKKNIKLFISGLVLASSCAGILTSLSNPSTNNKLNVSQLNNNNLSRAISLEGIDSVTIDHRVVDINLESWTNASRVITADKLDGYEIIKSGSFNLYQKNIVEIYLPNSMKTLEAGIFTDSRQDLKKIVIPESVETIEGNIFVDCDPEEVIVKNTRKFEMVDGCLYEKATKKLLMVTPKAGNNPTRTIRIKPDTKIIAPYAFSNLFGAGTYKKFKLNMNDFKNVVDIQDYAFLNANLESFNIANNVKHIGAAAFSGFMGTLSSENSNYNFDNRPKYDILVDRSTDTAMSLINQHWEPNELIALNFDYTHIGESFYIQTGPLLATENMNFSKKVLDIGSSAFTTVALKNVLFDPGSKLTRIDDFAFSNVNNNLNSTIESKYSSFNVKLPRSLRSLGESLFYNSGKGKVFIPNTVEHIGPGTNLNSWEVDIDLEPGNPNYTLKNGVIIENKTQTAICYDSDYLKDPASKGILVTDVDVKRIAPRSFTMLLSNPYFKGFEIKNPDIIIGNGAFLNTGEYKGVKQDIKVPDTMPELTKRYIVTQVMSWDFGPIQDYSNTGFGGGSWRGTVNGVSGISPIPKPLPYPPPGDNTTKVVLKNTPSNMLSFLPSQFLNLSRSEYLSWFEITNAGKNTVASITTIKANNLKGTFVIGIEIKNPIVQNVETTKTLYKEFTISGMKKATKTVIVQKIVPNPKIAVPNSFNELDKYLGFADTGEIINHDGIKSYKNPSKIIKTEFTVVNILNKIIEGKYADNYYDGKLHITIRIDNYYDSKGDFIAKGDHSYASMYQSLQLDGFDLHRQTIAIPENVRFTCLWIVLLCVGLVLLSMIIAIILMTWKKKKKRE